VTPEGVLRITGRTSDYINSGDIKVSSRAIEDVLLGLPEVNRAVAFGVPDADGLAVIWAAIVVAPPVDNAILNRLCGEKPGAAAPKFIAQMKDLPRDANGKVLTRELVAVGAWHYRSAS
jgi:acyl-coenzyme A synthetase/AMP-(fatty) acid ligase